uniref:Uncharacterized protein n=1 Tax=Acrobeloides nanus TaxID=290746 RepID=A0A914CA59_9BILA
MCEKGVSYSAETICAAVISAGASVGLDALMDSWGADEETVGIVSSGMTILVVPGIVITIVKVIKNKKFGEKRERFKDRVNAKLYKDRSCCLEFMNHFLGFSNQLRYVNFSFF